MSKIEGVKQINTLAHVVKEGDEVRTRSLELGLYKRMFQYTKPYRVTLYLLLVWVVLRAIQGPALAWLLAHTLNGPIQDGDLPRLYFWVACYAAMSFFTDYTLMLRQHYALVLGEGVIHDLREHIFRHLQSLNMGFFYTTRIGRIISRFTSDSENLRAGIQDAIFVAIVNIGSLVTAAAMMLYSDRWLFLVVLCWSPIYFLIYQFSKRKLTHAQRIVQESFSRITANLAESVVGIRVTQGYVRQDYNAELFTNLVIDHTGYNLGASRAAGNFNNMIELSNQLVLATLFMVGGYLALQTTPMTTVNQLIAFYFLTNMLLTPLVAIGNQYNTAITSMASAERVFDILDRKPDFTDPPDAVVLPPIKGKVEFRDVTFGYNPAKPVLHDVSFTARAGQTIALVGHTGSGKSSIINLVSKFYLPQKGELLIDGVDIRKIQSGSLHSQMGIVLQGNFLFTGTIRENIRSGRPEANDEEILDACRAIDCLDIIQALPDGLDTVVGERGAGISLGQRQLICFARAMLVNPRIMILDEATSSVDSITEAKIQKSLAIMLKGRTSFVVAHRLSTIRHASMVLVLDHGRIVERGTHEELLATGGVYANLYLQFIRATTA